MAKKKDVRPKAKASPDGALKRAFEKKGKVATKNSPKRQQQQQQQQKVDVSRTERSGFLSYIRAAMKGKCESTASQAETINRCYAGLGGEEKKAMIIEFYRNGAKKSWLELSV